MLGLFLLASLRRSKLSYLYEGSHSPLPRNRISFLLSSLFYSKIVDMTSYFEKLPGSESNLLLLPRELRLEIFGYLIPNRIHVYRRRDKFCLSACVGPISIGCEDSSKPYVDLYTNMPDGDERQSSPDKCLNPTWDATWARRLQSTWGPH